MLISCRSGMAGLALALLAAVAALVPARLAGAEELRSLIETNLATVEAADSLPKEIRDAAVERYQSALAALDRAREAAAAQAEFRASLEEFEQRTQTAQRELEKARTFAEEAAEVDAESFDGRSDLQAAMMRARAELAHAEAEAASLRTRADEMQTRQAGLPKLVEEAESAAASHRAQAERLRDVTGLAQSQGSELDAAEAALVRARAEAFAREAEALDLEASSHDARQAVLNLQLQAAETTAAALRTKLTALEGIERKQVAGKTEAAEDVISRATTALELSSGTERDAALAAEVDMLADMASMVRALAEQNELASSRLAEVQSKREFLQSSFDEIRELAQSGGLEGILAETIFSQLVSVHGILTDIAPRHGSRESKLEGQRVMFEARRTSRLAAARVAGASPNDEPLPALHGEVRQSVNDLREELDMGSMRLAQTLARTEAVERRTRSLVEEYRSAATAKLFWVRSSPPVNAAFFARLPGAMVGVVAALGAWAPPAPGLALAPLWALAGALLLLGLRLVFHRRLLAHVSKCNSLIRRVSGDRFHPTLSALGATLLASAPLPMAMLVLGAGLADATAEGAGSLLTACLITLAPIVFHLTLLANLVRNDGLAEGQFGWTRDVTVRLRTAVFWIAVIMIPSTILLEHALMHFSEDALSGVARLGLAIEVAGIGAVLAWLLRPRHGLPAAATADAPPPPGRALSGLWSTAILVASLVLVILLLSGHVMTVWLLASLLERSLAAVFWAVLIYALAIRLFAIRERKLKLEATIAERKARREAPASDTTGESGSRADELPDLKESDKPVDLTEVCRQTRDLIRFVVSAGLLATLWFQWTRFAPVVRVLDERDLFLGLSVSDLGLIGLVLMVALAVARNLPGLLEAMVLHRLDLDSGSRAAIITLAKYSVFAVAALVLSGQIGVDYAKLGWLAAALSVGIGFGLQEVVANFISGIILLFERPIRVGDVVTVDGIDGIVSRIQIRATTITGWDRKEYVVPNKNFVTGTVLNWTLSNPVNRIVITVGVAYGSDTDRAREILLDVARSNPNVLAEPTPLATFEEFGDSALKLVLRAYLPNMDNRITTLTNLNTAIAKRFHEAGIEIAFPQLDVHFQRKQPAK